MPILGEENLKRIDLITDDAYVVVLKNPKGDTFESLPEDATEAGNIMLEKLIREWNFTEKDGSPAPITSENIGRALSQFDVALINKELGLDKLIMTDKKKDSSSSTSTKKSEVVPPQNTSS